MVLTEPERSALNELGNTVISLFMAMSREKSMFLDTLSFLFCSLAHTKEPQDRRELVLKRMELISSLRAAIFDQHVTEGEMTNILELQLKKYHPRERRSILTHFSKHQLCEIQGDHPKSVSKHLLLYIEAVHRFMVDFSLIFSSSPNEDRTTMKDDRYPEILRNELLEDILDVQVKTVNQWRKIVAQMAVLAYFFVQTPCSDLIESSDVRRTRSRTNLPTSQAITRTTAWEEWQRLEELWQNLDVEVLSDIGIFGDKSTLNIPSVSRRDFFHPFFEKLSLLSVPTTCLCSKNAPRSTCFHVSASRTKELICLFVKYIILFNLLELLIKTQSFIPQHFWRKIVKHGIEIAQYDANALLKAYQNSASSKYWLIILLPTTLVGDDEAAVAALLPMLDRTKSGSYLTSLIYRVPITDKRDDRIIRAINVEGGELHVPLTPFIDYPPLAISDNQKMFFTSMSMIEDIFPVIYVETRNVAFINEVIGEFINLFNQYPQYEVGYPFLETLYNWYHRAQPPALPEETVKFLQNYKLLDKNGRLTELGTIIVKERLY